MRANRILYAPGVNPDGAEPQRSARLIRFADIPQPASYGLVAVLRFSLANRAAALGQPCEREHDRLQGGWYWLSGIALPSGRFAFVQEFDHHPGEVDLHLPIYREQHLFRQDFFAAVKLLSLTREQFTVCDGPYLWR
jgi:hypothetical protein